MLFRSSHTPLPVTAVPAAGDAAPRRRTQCGRFHVLTENGVQIDFEALEKILSDGDVITIGAVAIRYEAS